MVVANAAVPVVLTIVVAMAPLLLPLLSSLKEWHWRPQQKQQRHLSCFSKTSAALGTPRFVVDDLQQQ